MFLCIDTATAESGIAITDGKKIFFEKLETNHASDEILGKIDQLIRKADVQLSDLKVVFVVKGPGSFTGLRVGISVANQFAHQLKIPIVGLQTEEWYQHQTDEQDFIYLQTMNRDQVYMVGFGKYKRDFPQEIVAISDCHHELSSGRAVWLGQVNDEHRTVLSDIARITEVRSADKVWMEVARYTAVNPQKTYDLIEPFYGKEPTITKSKRTL